jgi:hypothetical protein
MERIAFGLFSQPLMVGANAKIRDHIKQNSKITDSSLAPSTAAAESYKKRTQHNSSTQQLLTAFLKERASNMITHLPTSSPPPAT